MLITSRESAMTSIAFDTLKYAKKLTAAGFTEQQAEALAEEQASLVENKLATKRDIEDVRRDIRDLESKLTIRLGGMLVVSVTAVATLVKLL